MQEHSIQRLQSQTWNRFFQYLSLHTPKWIRQRQTWYQKLLQLLYTNKSQGQGQGHQKDMPLCWILTLTLHSVALHPPPSLFACAGLETSIEKSRSTSHMYTESPSELNLLQNYVVHRQFLCWYMCLELVSISPERWVSFWVQHLDLAAFEVAIL